MLIYNYFTFTSINYNLIFYQLACIAGAIRKFLAEYQPEVLNKSLSLRAGVPIDLRPADYIMKTLGNKFGALLIHLPVGVESPIERLLKVKKNMDEAKNSPEKLISYILSQLSGYMPNFIMRMLLSSTTKNISVAISNVRGGEAEFHLLKRKIIYNIGCKDHFIFL